MMDFGYPQSTEYKILQEYITQHSHRMEMQPRPPMAVTNAVSWRSEGIVHKKNEIFLDVIERLNLLVASNGSLLHSEIIGSVKVKSYLINIQYCSMSFNPKLYIGGIGRDIRASDLEDAFERYGRIRRVDIKTDYAFVVRYCGCLLV